MTLEPPDTPADMRVEGLHPVGTHVAEVFPLACRPEILHGIELRGICRKPFRPEPVCLRLQELPHDLRPMRRQSIPEQKKLPAKMASHLLHRPDNDRTRHAPGDDPQKQSRLPSRGRADDEPHGRTLRPARPGTENRRQPFPGPRPLNEGTLRESRLVPETERQTMTTSPFFSRGQVSATQARMASSSRSFARTMGFWQLHPMSVRTFHT